MQITQIQQIFPFLYYPQPYRLKISAISAISVGRFNILRILGTISRTGYGVREHELHESHEYSRTG